MSARELAHKLDHEERARDAVDAYEALIVSGEARLEDYLDLAVLYLQCGDGGFVAQHHLTQEFVDRAWERVAQVLDEAESRFGDHNEVAFWRLYKQDVVGDEVQIDDVITLAQRGPSLVPYFFLFASDGGERYVDEARQLMDICHGRTTRERLIRSFLTSHVQDAKWRSSGQPVDPQWDFD